MKLSVNCMCFYQVQVVQFHIETEMYVDCMIVSLCCNLLCVLQIPSLQTMVLLALWAAASTQG